MGKLSVALFQVFFPRKGADSEEVEQVREVFNMVMILLNFFLLLFVPVQHFKPWLLFVWLAYLSCALLFLWNPERESIA
jgi:hypothetical protein